MNINASIEEWPGKYPLWATFFSLLIVFLCSCISRTISATRKILKSTNDRRLPSLHVRGTSDLKSVQVTDDDLKALLLYLEGADEHGVAWEQVIHKQNVNFSYSAKRRDPKDGGATQYFSTTVFENCSPKLLRDFYMDNDYRLEWDKTILKHAQLEICLDTGTEVGCTLKKFPLMTTREYVLAWRIWEAGEQSFYCVIKSCEHHCAPRLPSRKRVEPYFSGWRICKVPGRFACEITMFHQEELGMRRELAKLAFTRGIWNYVKGMESSLRKYPARINDLKVNLNAVACADQISKGQFCTPSNQSDQITMPFMSTDSSVASKVHSKRAKFLGKSLLLLGGTMFLSRSSAKLGAKIAAAFIARKLLNSFKIYTGNSKYTRGYFVVALYRVQGSQINRASSTIILPNSVQKGICR